MNKRKGMQLLPEIKIHGIAGEFVDHTIDMEADPTDMIYQQLKVPFTYFNWALFHGILPDCVFTLTLNSKRTLGYFRSNGFVKKDGARCDEIAMNPRIFLCDDLSYVLSIIVHEMAHMWKHHFGKTPCRGGYHCKEWGAKMDRLGLPPSNTGKSGGKRTGYQMMHYIEKDGAFDHACRYLLSQGFAMIWGFAQQQAVNRKNIPPDIDKKQKLKNKRKFLCPVCNAIVWGKPTTFVICGQDRVVMQEVGHDT